jgi:alkylation response protein AidB-like acyl-CoA dehydrogenase
MPRRASSSAVRSAPTRRWRTRSADTYIETELARSLAYWAAWCVAEHDEQTEVAVAAAKRYAADAAVAACERAIQVARRHRLHLEHPLHRYYKRALWIQAYDGYTREQRAKVAAWLLDRQRRRRCRPSAAVQTGHVLGLTRAVSCPASRTVTTS